VTGLRGIGKRKIWSILFVLFFLAAAVLFINDQRSLLSSLSGISVTSLLSLVLLRSLFLSTNGLILRQLSAKFGIPLKAVEWVGLSFTTTMGNFLVPFAGGMVARAAYMKYRHGLPYAAFLSMLAATYLIYFPILGLAGVITLLPLAGKTVLSWYLLVLMAALIVIAALPMIVPSFKIPPTNRVTVVFNHALQGWSLIKTDRILVIKVALYCALNIFLNGFSFWVAYSAFLLSPASFFETFLVGLLSTFSFIFTFTPGNLGVQEAIIGLSSGGLGIGTALGLFVSSSFASPRCSLPFSSGFRSA